MNTTIPDFLTHITTPTPCRTNNLGYIGDTTADDRAEACRRCSSCPVLNACRQWAIRHQEEGVWGGTDDHDRNVYRRTGRLPHRTHRPIPALRPPTVARSGCGTETRYRRHRAAGEECLVCRTALLARLVEELHGRSVTYGLEVLLRVPRCDACRAWCRAKSADARAKRGAVAAGTVVAAPVVGKIAPGALAAVQRFGRVA